jgi:hypothetical protein
MGSKVTRGTGRDVPLSINSIVILPMTAGALDFAMDKPFMNQGDCQEGGNLLSNPSRRPRFEMHRIPQRMGIDAPPFTFLTEFLAG